MVITLPTSVTSPPGNSGIRAPSRAASFRPERFRRAARSRTCNASVRCGLRYRYTVQSFEPGRVICLVAESRSFVATDTMTFHSRDVHGRHGWTDVTYTVSF